MNLLREPPPEERMPLLGDEEIATEMPDPSALRALEPVLPFSQGPLPAERAESDEKIRPDHSFSACGP